MSMLAGELPPWRTRGSQQDTLHDSVPLFPPPMVGTRAKTLPSPVKVVSP